MAGNLENLITKGFMTEWLKDYGLGGVIYNNVLTKKLTGRDRGDVITFPGVGEDITIVTNRPNTTPLAPNFVDGRKAQVTLDNDAEIRVDFRRTQLSMSAYEGIISEYKEGIKRKRDMNIDIVIAKRVAQSPNTTKQITAAAMATPQNAYDFANQLIGLVLAELPKGETGNCFLECDFFFENLLKQFYRLNVTANTGLFEKDGKLFLSGFEICRTPAIFNDGTHKNIFAHTKEAIGFASSLSDMWFGRDTTYNSNVLLGTDNFGANTINGKYVALGKYQPS